MTVGALKPLQSSGPVRVYRVERQTRRFNPIRHLRLMLRRRSPR